MEVEGILLENDKRYSFFPIINAPPLKELKNR